MIHESIALTYAEEIPRLRSMLRKYERDPSMVDDLLQDTAVEALSCAAKLNCPNSAKAWLYAISRNLARNHVARRVRESNFILAPRDADEPDHLGAIDGKRLDPYAVASYKNLEKKMYSLLSPDLATTAKLVWINDFTYEEAALNLQIPVGTIRSRLNRARSILSSRFIALSA